MPTIIGVTDPYRTLLLLRHRRSDYPPESPTMSARSRRGACGREPRSQAIGCGAAAVDAVLCSTAARAETLVRTRIDAPSATSIGSTTRRRAR